VADGQESNTDDNDNVNDATNEVNINSNNNDNQNSINSDSASNNDAVENGDDNNAGGGENVVGDANEDNWASDDNDLIKPKPGGGHLGGMKKVVADAVAEALAPLTSKVGKAAQEVEKIAKHVADLEGANDVNAALAPLKQKLNDMFAKVSSGAQSREKIEGHIEEASKEMAEIRKKMDEAGDQDIESKLAPVKQQLQDVADKVAAASSAIGGAVKRKDLDGVAKKSDIQSLAKGVGIENAKHQAKVKKGINKLGKVVTKTQKYAKAIYKDIHNAHAR